VLENYLPPKSTLLLYYALNTKRRTAEYVVFIAPSKVQMDIFESVLSPRLIASFLQGLMQPLGLSEWPTCRPNSR